MTWADVSDSWEGAENDSALFSVPLQKGVPPVPSGSSLCCNQKDVIRSSQTNLVNTPRFTFNYEFQPRQATCPLAAAAWPRPLSPRNYEECLVSSEKSPRWMINDVGF